jgi:hypothetical protein
MDMWQLERSFYCMNESQVVIVVVRRASKASGHDRFCVKTPLQTPNLGFLLAEVENTSRCQTGHWSTEAKVTGIMARAA